MATWYGSENQEKLAANIGKRVRLVSDPPLFGTLLKVFKNGNASWRVTEGAAEYIGQVHKTNSFYLRLVESPAELLKGAAAKQLDLKLGTEVEQPQ